MSSPALPVRQRPMQEREQLDLFRALPGDMAPRDSQDLMAFPFFSLAKSRRVAPIDFRAGNVTIRVEGTAEHGIATIWDADILIWAASQIVEARDAGLRPSRLMQATPYEILRFIGRGTSLRDYQRLKAALDRLQSTTVATSIRETTGRRLHRFSWINEWKELADASGTPLGIELILPDWFYAGVIDAALVLTIDPAYFRLTGGIERWLYRLVRKHGGRQEHGWQFDFQHLYRKSGSVARYYDFAADLRALVARQSLPGYHLGIEHGNAAAVDNRHAAINAAATAGLSNMEGQAMIVALLNQKGGVGKTTLATHIAGELAMRGQHVVLLDADPQGSSLDWTQRRSQQGLPRLFSAVGLARETLHQEAPELARRADHVVIDGPPRIAALARSALLAAERVLIPVQPSPYDLWASAEMVALIREAQVFRPALRAAFVINRRVSTTVIGREARQALADQPLPALRAEVHQRIVFADSVAAGRLARETAPDSAAAREITVLVDELLRWTT
ncbi:hypothetical protein BFJ63_vAg16616 [Fusarium oxysporum f. sp. narcissi]|nr:hypothetical protein BFJ63_vAg16616 [Fusarium oxysporum f. sp. narcissi]